MANTYFRRDIDGVPGMTLLGVSESRFKLASVSASLILPLEKGRTGARALAPYILKSSCSLFDSSLAMKRHIAMMYGAELDVSVQRLGDMQQVIIGVTFLDDRYTIGGEKLSERCAALLCDVMLRPAHEGEAFRESDTEREKRLLIELIEAERNDKLGYSIERCIRLAGENEPFGTDPKGSTEEISALTGRDAYSAWRELIETARIDIVAVGTLDFDGIAGTFAKGFAQVCRRPAALPGQTVTGKGAGRSITERAPVTQTNLVRLLRLSPDTDRYAARLMAACLGGSVSSLFFKHIREELSLCYYCAASYVRSKHVLLVYSGLSDDKLGLAGGEISSQIALAAGGGLTEEDIEAARLAVTDGFRQVYDSVGATVMWYVTRVLEDKPDTPEEAAERIKAVGTEDIVRAASSLSPDAEYILRPSMRPDGCGEESADE